MPFLDRVHARIEYKAPATRDSPERLPALGYLKKVRHITNPQHILLTF
jgi:hypothetical protein